VLALLASVVVFLYGILPGMLFRAIFSAFLPLRSFERTRTDEIRFSVLVCVVPFVLALVMVWSVPGARDWPLPFADTPQQRNADYRTLLDAAVSDRVFEENRPAFWQAAGRSSRRHGRFLVWYYLLVSVEALTLGWLSRTFPTRPRRQWLAQKFLVPNISTWHVLLTRWLYPGATEIAATILTDGDHLYRGKIVSHTAAADGSLVGVYLQDAERFDRVGYLRTKEKKPGGAIPAAYWKPILGERLLIFGSSIQTLNVMPRVPIDIVLEPLKGESLGPLEVEVGP
jgi:hypothetical protein